MQTNAAPYKSFILKTVTKARVGKTTGRSGRLGLEILIPFTPFSRTSHGLKSLEESSQTRRSHHEV